MTAAFVLIFAMPEQKALYTCVLMVSTVVLLTLLLLKQDPRGPLCHGHRETTGGASRHLRPAAATCALLVQGQVSVCLCL